jgi:hypothetical protein
VVVLTELSKSGMQTLVAVFILYMAIPQPSDVCTYMGKVLFLDLAMPHYVCGTSILENVYMS